MNDSATPAKKTTPFQKARFLFAVAGIGVAIWLLIEIVVSAVHGVEGVASFRMPPGSVSEGEAWGMYGVYAAVVLAAAVPLDKTETVKVPADWLVAFLALIALTLVPGALLLIPAHAVLDAAGPPVSLACGSWLYPATVLAHSVPCVASLETRFRWAAAVAAVGLAGPYLVMARSLRAGTRARAQARTAQAAADKPADV